MLWDIQALMKPALSVIDLIPNIHRTPTLAMLRRAVLEGRPLSTQLSAEDKELTFHDARVALTSPIGARVLKSLYACGHLKLKKPPGNPFRHLTPISPPKRPSAQRPRELLQMMRQNGIALPRSSPTLAAIASGHPQSRIDDLLPWNFRPSS
ncbi:hypothetical protein [Szabonella alba]|uniref:hypothetical protein n=1 Tax=Szabonella alba TaxID=2804194 RepID=UPI001F42A40B|nr:hypothetical protein [Szabonella alba]